jgi:hypothetical protein
MWFKKPEAVVCAVRGKTIAPSERQFVEKNRKTKTAQQMNTFFRATTRGLVILTFYRKCCILV